MPEISVIVPVYKVESYLRRCVDSILNQTFQNFELILVDDGSPDNCGAICDEYAVKDSRVYVIHQENGGLSAARNTGIDWAFANSDSQWLSFVDSDDWIHPQSLEALLTAANKTQLPVSITSFERVTTERDATSFDWNPENIEVWETESLFYEKNVEATVAWNKLYKKELFQDLRYPVGKIHEDEFLTYQVIFQTKQVVYIPRPMYWYFQNPNGIMSSKSWHSLCQSSEAYKEQALFFHQNLYIRLRDVSIRRMLNQQRHAIQKAKERREYRTASQLEDDLTRKLRWVRNDLGIHLYGNEFIFEGVMPRRAVISRKWRHFKMWLYKLWKR